MENYKYIGALEPSLPSNRFTTSIFTTGTESNFFLQIEELGKVTGFKLIAPPAKIKNVEANLELQVGDDIIYSFITSQSDLIYGNRQGIEPKLLELLKTNALNSHSKLIISNFLHLYGKTIDYVHKSNKDLEKRGVKSLINEDLIFQNTIPENEAPDDLFNLIDIRYNSLKSINSNIDIDDIAFIFDDNAYFQNIKIKINKFFSKKSIRNSGQKTMLAQVINLCNKRNKIDVGKLVNSSNETFEFLLQSAAVSFEQKKIETLISEKINETPNSVIDVGLAVDKQLSDVESQKEITDFRWRKNNENEILASFTSITGRLPEVLNFSE